MTPTEASRPRFVVQMVRATGVGGYHSKGLTGISRDGAVLFFADGSGNPSKRGFGGFATASDGTPAKGSSHETMTVTCAPAVSVLARQHLAECDRFTSALGRQGRLLPTNQQTTRPIREVEAVAIAEQEVEARREAGNVAAAETKLAKATSEAWAEQFKVRFLHSALPLLPVKSLCTDCILP